MARAADARIGWGPIQTLRTAFEKIAMSAPVPLGSGFDAALPRKLARKIADADQLDRDRV